MENYKKMVSRLHETKKRKTGNASVVLLEEDQTKAQYAQFLRFLISLSEEGATDLSAINSHIDFHTHTIASLIKEYGVDRELLINIVRGFKALQFAHKNQQALAPSRQGFTNTQLTPAKNQLNILNY